MITVSVLVLAWSVGASESAARPGSFSAPVRLGTLYEQWTFAVNDRGQAIGVAGAAGGVAVYPISRSGRLGKPWLVRVPGSVGVGEVSAEIDHRGRIALGMIYGDGTREPSENPSTAPAHPNPGCCSQIAIDTWMYGKTPPAAQTFSKPVDGTVGEATRPPSVVTSGDAIAAAWTRGHLANSVDPETSRELEFAYGQVGEPLKLESLPTDGQEVAGVHLGKTRGGRIVANWIQAPRNLVMTAVGAPASPLQVIRSQRLAGLPRQSEYVEHPDAISEDSTGDILLAFFAGPFSGRDPLEVVVSTNGGPFRKPRLVLDGMELSEITVRAGSGTGVLVLSEKNVRLGSLFGPYTRTLSLPESELEGPPQGWPVGRGIATVVLERGHGAETRLQAVQITHKGLSAPRHLAPALDGLHCELNRGEDLEVPPVASSPNGNAILYVTCRKTTGEEQYAGQYLIRYSP